MTTVSRTSCGAALPRSYKRAGILVAFERHRNPLLLAIKARQREVDVAGIVQRLRQLGVEIDDRDAADRTAGAIRNDLHRILVDCKTQAGFQRHAQRNGEAQDRLAGLAGVVVGDGEARQQAGRFAILVDHIGVQLARGLRRGCGRTGQAPIVKSLGRAGPGIVCGDAAYRPAHQKADQQYDTAQQKTFDCQVFHHLGSLQFLPVTADRIRPEGSPGLYRAQHLADRRAKRNAPSHLW